MKLLELLRRKKPVTSDLEQAVADAAAAITAAEAELAAADTAYRESLLSPDDNASVAASERRARATVAVDRARALHDALQERLAAAREADQEAERAKVYQDAQRRSQAAAEALARYPDLAQQIVSILGTVAQAELSIRTANENLPAGANPLRSVEFEIRGLPDQDREIIGEELLPETWFYRDNDARVEDAFLGQIELAEDGITGVLVHYSDGRREFPVVKRRERKVEFLPARGAFIPDALAATVNLPGLLPGQASFWEATGRTSLWGPPGSDAEVILEEIEQRTQAAAQPPKDPRGERMLDWTTEIIEADEPDPELVAAVSALE